MTDGFAIVRDPRGSLVHIRTAEGHCIGCIEVGLFEIVRGILRREEAASVGEGIPAHTAAGADSTPGGGRL